MYNEKESYTIKNSNPRCLEPEADRLRANHFLVLTTRL